MFSVTLPFSLSICRSSGLANFLNGQLIIFGDWPDLPNSRRNCQLLIPHPAGCLPVSCCLNVYNWLVNLCIFLLVKLIKLVDFLQTSQPRRLVYQISIPISLLYRSPEKIPRKDPHVGLLARRRWQGSPCQWRFPERMTMGSNSQVVKCGLDLSLRRLGPTGMAGAILSGVSHHENLEDFRNHGGFLHGGFLQENLNLTWGLKHKAWTKSPSLCVANRLCQRWRLGENLQE